ncbi:MAG TPA: ATPase domain-containing protein [Thermoanaerobaculia bacterium]
MPDHQQVADAEKEFFLTTGTPAFEQLFYGEGIRVHKKEGTSILIEGDAGLGKTTLALQLAATAVDKGDTSCLYYSFEQSTRELGEMISAYGWGIDEHVEAHAWRGENISFGRRFNLIDAHEVIGLNVDATLDNIERHSRGVSERFRYLSPIIVLDSIGAIEELTTLERRHLGRLIGRLNRWNAILILVREKRATSDPVPSEYLTNVVIDLQAEHSMLRIVGSTGGLSYPASIPRNLLELKKTRNQRAHRGPHEFSIVAGSNQQRGGIVVFPSLQSIAARGDEAIGTPIDLEEIKGEKRALFGIPRLDERLGHIDKEGTLSPGMPFGQSLLVKGLPGSLKTELGVQFLLQALDQKDESEVLFVSCRIDRFALEGLEIYSSPEEKTEFLGKNLRFIDARHPYRTPEQVMASIVQAVEENEPIIRRAVIFGIGMLDTLPAFQRNALPFLQVLSGYFRQRRVSGLFIDWPRPHEERNLAGPLIRPTELAGDFVAGALEIDKGPRTKQRKGVPAGRPITLVRKDHRFIDELLGYLSLNNHRCVIQEKVQHD